MDGTGMDMAAGGLDATAVERATLRKLTWRITGFAGLLYFFNWLDRFNVGFAALQMNQDLHFTPTVYGLANSLFFLGFGLFEIPSNLMLHRVGARVWIARIMITWGLVCAATALVQGIAGFYSLRFVLGVAEAGFTPGLVLYFSSWFPAAHRARAFAYLFAAPLLAPVIGGPLCGWILQSLSGVRGLAGWQWMFILEGLPSVLLGLVILAVLKDRPEQAPWLTHAEKHWLAATLDAERRALPPVRHASVGRFLRDRRLWALTAIYFFWSFSGYGIILWLPLIMKEATGLPPLRIGFLSALPFLCAIAGLVLVGRHSDRTGERKGHILLFAVLTAAALVACSLTTSLGLGLVLLCVSGFCIWAQQGVFWTLPASYLAGRSAAGGIALVNMGAATGGFIGPLAIGRLRDATGSYVSGLLAIGATSLAVAFIVLATRIPRARAGTVPRAAGAA